MRRRLPWPRVAALGMVPAAFGLLVIGTVATRIHSSEETPFFVITAVASIPLLVLGNLVARREPANAVGALLAFAGVVLAAQGADTAYHTAALARPDVLPSADVVVSLGQGGWMWFYTPFALLLLFFPTGRLPSRRWALVGVGVVVVTLAFQTWFAMAPMPYDPPYQDAPKALGTLPVGESTIWVVAFALLAAYMACLVASAASLRIRYRRAAAKEAAQLKWMALAGLSVPAALLVCWLSFLLVDGPDLVLVALPLMFASVPAATAVAILRHDLYDVDRVFSTAVTYVLVTGALLGVFAGISLVVGLAFGDSDVATAVATATCALGLQPLRLRLQRGVNRRLYPLRQGALAAIADLRRRTATGEAQPEQLETVLRQALHDPGLRVVYRAPGSDRHIDRDGTEVAIPPLAVAIRSGDRDVGWLLPSRGLPGALAREVADDAAVLVEVAALRREIAAALDDVAASRARLLQAGYAERRELVRDLQGGAVERLVSLGMGLRVAQRRVRDRPLDVRALLDEAVAELATAVAELRQVAHGLRPSALDDGLGPALELLTSKLAVPVELDIRAGDLDDAVRTTAYYVAAEAVRNAVEHARPGRIALSVAQDGHGVEVRVRDDGAGGASLRPGAGLAVLQDRVAALGGSLAVDSVAGAGTEVRAVLPCAS